MKATTEKAFEAYVEETLFKKGWTSVSNEHWDKKRAIFPSLVLNFIQVTQLDLYTSMVKLHGTELDAKLIEALTKERDSKAHCMFCGMVSNSMEKLFIWPISNQPMD